MQNQLSRDANMLQLQARRYRQQRPRIRSSRRSSSAPSRSTPSSRPPARAASTFVLNADQTIATSALARLKFVENSLGRIYSMDDKIVAGLKEAKSFLVDIARRCRS